MRCVSRRVADGTLLSVIKSWLTAPVIERDQRTIRRTTEAKDRQRGTPQGSPISPLLANLYFRRFLLAWEVFGHRTRLDAYVVNYADDLVICCRPVNGPTALTTMRQLMMRLGLTVNEANRFSGPTRSCAGMFNGFQRWLMRRSGQAGTGYRQHPDEYLYETLGLYALPLRRADLPSAKV